MIDLDARPLAVVTGASSGIGRALAAVLADHGFDLVLAAEDHGIHRVADVLGGSGLDVVGVQVDLATPQGVEALAEHVRAVGRPPEVLCLNAGVGVGGPFVESDLEEQLRLVALDVTGVVHLARLLLPPMVGHGLGRVLVTSSIAAVMPGPWLATYAASKAFLSSFAQALRVELEGTGVSVTALLPGPTDTAFFARAGIEDSRLGQGPKDDPADVAKDAYEALVAGADHVVAGSFRNRVQVATAKVVPDTVAADLHGALAAPAEVAADR